MPSRTMVWSSATSTRITSFSILLISEPRSFASKPAPTVSWGGFSYLCNNTNPCGSGLARESVSPNTTKPSGLSHRHTHTQCRALPRLTFKRQLPAHDQHPLTHTHHAKGCRPTCSGNKSYAIIADSQAQLVAVQCQCQFDSMRLGMAHDIGQCFLKNPEQANRLGIAEHRQILRHLHQARDLGASLKTPGLPLNGRGDPGIENRWPQRRGHITHQLKQLSDQPLHAVQAFVQPQIGRAH